MPTLVAGIRALLMQTLHPGAMAGVHDWSRYKTRPAGAADGHDPLDRRDHVRLAPSRRDRESARVSRFHDRVNGRVPGGWTQRSAIAVLGPRSRAAALGASGVHRGVPRLPRDLGRADPRRRRRLRARVGDGRASWSGAERPADDARRVARPARRLPHARASCAATSGWMRRCASSGPRRSRARGLAYSHPVRRRRRLHPGRVPAAARAAPRLVAGDHRDPRRALRSPAGPSPDRRVAERPRARRSHGSPGCGPLAWNGDPPHHRHRRRSTPPATTTAEATRACTSSRSSSPTAARSRRAARPHRLPPGRRRLARPGRRPRGARCRRRRDRGARLRRRRDRRRRRSSSAPTSRCARAPRAGRSWSSHLVDADASLTEGDTVTVEVDATYRAALSAGHTACHLASLALNAALAGAWTKEPRLDSLGSPDFDGAANETSTILEHGARDTYRVGKSVRKAGFDPAALDDPAALADTRERDPRLVDRGRRRDPHRPRRRRCSPTAATGSPSCPAARRASPAAAPTSRRSPSSARSPSRSRPSSSRARSG